MKKLLALLCLLLLPMAAWAEGLQMYRETGTYPGNDRVRLCISDMPCITGEVIVDLGINKRVPVYAMPATTAYRAAGGKAVVSLREPFTALAWAEDDNYNWLLIDYTIGEPDALGNSQHRIGYIRRSELPRDFECDVPTVQFNRIILRLSREGYLYDDINGLMKSVGKLPAGEAVVVLGWVNHAWAYVVAEIGNEMGYFFLPMAVLEAPEETEDAAMMAALTGSWVFAGGGEMLGDGVIFDGGGNLRILETADDGAFLPTTLTDRGRVCEYSVYPDPHGDMTSRDDAFVLEIREAGRIRSRMRLHLHTDEEDGRIILTVESGMGGGSYLYAPDVTILPE